MRIHVGDLRNPRRFLACLAIAGSVAAAIGSPFTPEEGRFELLSSPLWIGIPLVLLCVLHESIVRRSKTWQVSVTSSILLLLTVGTCLLRLAIVVFTPLASRDMGVWQLWPLFTVLHLAFLSTLSLMGTFFIWGVMRFIGRTTA